MLNDRLTLLTMPKDSFIAGWLHAGGISQGFKLRPQAWRDGNDPTPAPSLWFQIEARSFRHQVERLTIAA